MCAGWDMVVSVLQKDVCYPGVLLACNYHSELCFEQVSNE